MPANNQEQNTCLYVKRDSWMRDHVVEIFLSSHTFAPKISCYIMGRNNFFARIRIVEDIKLYVLYSWTVKFQKLFGDEELFRLKYTNIWFSDDMNKMQSYHRSFPTMDRFSRR